MLTAIDEIITVTILTELLSNFPVIFATELPRTE